jgi:hypothetical protein
MVNSPSRSAKRRTRRLVQSIPTIRNASRKNCPAGMIRKKAYVRSYSTAVRRRGYTVRKANGKSYRVFPKASNMHIESKCVRDTGNPGKGPAIFGPLREGDLAKYGYSFRRPESVRHGALRKAVGEYGASSVYHKLDAVTKLFKHTKPKIYAVFKADREWVRKQIGK